MIKRIFRINYLFFIILSIALTVQARESPQFSVSIPRVVLNDIQFHITLIPSVQYISQHANQKVLCTIHNAQNNQILYSDSILIHTAEERGIKISNISLATNGRTNLNVSLGGVSRQISTRVLPSFFSILPPLLAIILALITRQVIVALFFGIWLGITFIYDFNPLIGFLHTLDEYIVNALASPDRISILIFSLVLGGMIGVITRSGGTQGIVEKLRHYAKNARLGQLATWAMGVLIFFDDYANTLIVGNTMLIR